MFNGKKEHYRQYYQYTLPPKETPCTAVNNLYDSVMRNEKTALEQMLRILSSSVYNMICSRLEKTGDDTLENIDDVMQDILIEVLKKAFRGFPSYVKKDNLYPYLIRLAENRIENFKRENCEIKNHERYNTEEYSILNVMENNKTSSSAALEKKVLQNEKNIARNIILINYIAALQESKHPPYQLLTYCYAVLIPQLFKKTTKKELLCQIDAISGRKSMPPNSHYNEEKNCLEGDITRNSSILLKWALSAIYKQTVGQLNQEFLSLYNIEKIADIAFQWGIHYQENMEKEYENVPMRQVIITEMFEESSIKNWPQRIAASLLRAVEQQLLSQKEFCENAIEIVEEMLK